MRRLLVIVWIRKATKVRSTRLNTNGPLQAKSWICGALWLALSRS